MQMQMQQQQQQLQPQPQTQAQAQPQPQTQTQALTAAAPGQAAGATGAGVGMVAGQQPLAARSAGAPGSAGLLVNSRASPTMPVGPASDAALVAACAVATKPSPKSAFKKPAPTRSQEASAPAATSTGAAAAAAPAPILAPQPVSLVGPRAVLLPQQLVSVVGSASGSEAVISQPFLVGSQKLNAELSAVRI